MASGLPDDRPNVSSSATWPTIVAPNDDADTLLDSVPYAGDERFIEVPNRDHDRDSSAPPRSPLLLRPQSQGYRPSTPTLTFSMASDDATTEGATSASTPSPFNFQTQFISTSPVKSVSQFALLLFLLYTYRRDHVSVGNPVSGLFANW